MPLRRARVDIPLGLGAEFEKESQNVKRGCVRFFERTIAGEKVLVMVVNRDDGFRVVVLENDGKARTLYDGEEDGE